jgi:uncharacterized membrane protein
MRGVLTLAFVIVFAGVAAAQDTGGSIGGGSWDSDSGGGGSYDYSSSSSSSDYSSSSSSSSSYDYHSSTSGSSSSGSGRGASSGEVILAVLFLVICGGIWVYRTMGGSTLQSYPDYTVSSPTPAGVDVTVLRFALDARTRPFVQKELDRIAKSADTKTPDGLATTLREVALMLRRLRDGWVYGGAHNFAMTGKGQARASFEQHVGQARALFKRELVRNAAGTVTTGDTGDYPRRSHEGPGLVLVTVVVAAKGELFTVARIGDGDNLRQALEVLGALTPQTLMAMEIVWTPADPEDRMSSLELEALLPDDIFPIEGAMVGKVVCTYCGGPFPMELLSCPHCGGRLDSSA